MTNLGAARRRSLARVGLPALLAAAAVLVAWPSSGQETSGQETSGPRSLLPDAFGPAPVVNVAPPTAVIAPAQPDESDTDAATPAPADTAEAATTSDSFDVSAATGRAIDVAGSLTPAIGGYGMATFAGSDGRFVAGLMRRIDAPVASRWAHIVLRRALLSESTTPADINPANWIAERARLLLAMGEVDGAKALIDNLPTDRFTPLLYRVAGQIDLAAADLPGLCPLAATGEAVSVDPMWRLAEAMCGAMSGDDITAASNFDSLRDGSKVEPFDVMLGERIAMISGGGGRAANVDWDAIDHLTPYRFGVATAAGVAIPLPLLTKAGEATRGASWGWVLRAPNQSVAAREAALRPAAAIGISSAAEMVSAISADTADLDRSALDASPAGALRQAYAAGTIADRVAAMRTIWTGGTGAADTYAAHIETALAAARLPVDKGYAADAPDLIGAMLSAGIDAGAARWAMVGEAGDATARAKSWALLAAGAPLPTDVTPDRFRAWMKSDDTAGGRHRAQLLLAALDGLGRTAGGNWADLHRDLGLGAVSNSWTQAIDAAAAAGHVGEVAVLAATGLQSTWSAVPPAHFARIIAAYVRVGRGHEARMMAAEAVMRG